MDANGLHFWMIADDAQWERAGEAPGADPEVEFDVDSRRLRLSSRRTPLAITEDRDDAVARLEIIPRSIDDYGTSAAWDVDSARILASGALPGSVPLAMTPPATQPSDLAIGYDGLLYLAVDG